MACFLPKPIIRTSMGEIHDQLERFVTKWFQSQNDVVNQEISIGFTNFVPPCNVIKDRMSGSGSSGLVKYVQGFDGLEFVFFVHVVF